MSSRNRIGTHSRSVTLQASSENISITKFNPYFGGSLLYRQDLGHG